MSAESRALSRSSRRRTSAALRVALACGLLLGPGGCEQATAPRAVGAGATPSTRSGYAVDITTTDGVADTTRATGAGGAP